MCIFLIILLVFADKLLLKIKINGHSNYDVQHLIATDAETGDDPNKPNKLFAFEHQSYANHNDPQSKRNCYCDKSIAANDFAAYFSCEHFSIFVR